MQVERALVLWNFVLYFFACGTRSGIVEFCVIYFHILRKLLEIIKLLFVHVCCIFRVVLKSHYSLQQLLLVFVWKIFGQTLKETVLSELIK